MHNYILDDNHIPVIEDDLYAWGRWMEAARRSGARTVGRTDIPGGFISTVFLGIDHSFIGGGPPVLFETMVFANERGGEDLDSRRYSTWGEALDGHNAFVDYYATHGVAAAPRFTEEGEEPPPPLFKPEESKYKSDGKVPKRRMKFRSK